MEPGYIDFNVNVGAWKASHKTDVNNDLGSFSEAMGIARSTMGVDAVVEDNLRAITDLNKVDEIIGGEMRTVGTALYALSGRKFGKLLVELTDKKEWQAKEKKEIQELIRMYASRKILRHFGTELNYGLPTKTFSTGKIHEGTIQFISNYPAWKCVKKFRIEENVNRRTVAEFITSYTITLDLRFETYLPKLLNVNELETFLKKSPGKAATPEQLMTFLNESEFAIIIQRIASKGAPGHIAECVNVLRAYATRKVLKEKGIIVEATQIKSLPGWKRVIGKRK